MQNLVIGLTNLLIFFTSLLRDRALVLEGSTRMRKDLYLPCFGPLILNDSSIVFRVGLQNTPVLETSSRSSPIDWNTLVNASLFRALHTKHRIDGPRWGLLPRRLPLRIS